MKAVKNIHGVIIVGEKTIPFVFEKSKLKKCNKTGDIFHPKKEKFSKNSQKKAEKVKKVEKKMDLQNKLYLWSHDNVHGHE